MNLQDKNLYMRLDDVPAVDLQWGGLRTLLEEMTVYRRILE